MRMEREGEYLDLGELDQGEVPKLLEVLLLEGALDQVGQLMLI